MRGKTEKLKSLEQTSKRVLVVPEDYGDKSTYKIGAFWAGRSLKEEQKNLKFFDEAGFKIVRKNEHEFSKGDIGIGADDSLVDASTRTEIIAEKNRLDVFKEFDKNDIKNLPYPIVLKDKSADRGEGVYVINNLDCMLRFMVWLLMSQNIGWRLVDEKDPNSIVESLKKDVLSGDFSNDWFFTKKIGNNWSFQELVKTPSEYYTSMRIVADAYGAIHYAMLIRSLQKKGLKKRNNSKLKVKSDPLEDLKWHSYRDYLLEHPDSPFFLNSDNVVSNAYQGGRKIFLNGEKVTDLIDRKVLISHGIDPDRPLISEEEMQKASLIGIQCAGMSPYVGIDFIRDADDNLRLLLAEVNNGCILSPEGLGVSNDEFLSNGIEREEGFSDDVQEYCEEFLLKKMLDI